MNAAVYYENGGPEVLRYEDVPDPACPPNGVVVDVEVISLEGGDTLHRGHTPLASKPHIVVDPNALNPQGTTAIDWFVPSMPAL